MKILFNLCFAIMFFSGLMAENLQSEFQNESIVNSAILEIKTSEEVLFAYRPDPEQVQRTAEIAKEIFIEAFSTSYQAYYQNSGSTQPIEKWLRLKNGLTLETWLAATYEGEYEEYLLGLKGFLYISREDGSLVGWLSYNWNQENGELYLSQGSLQADTRQKKVATSFFVELFKKRGLEAVFPGIKEVKLITRKINTAARGLFAKCGFIFDEVIDPSVYGDSYDDRYIGYRLTVSPA